MKKVFVLISPEHEPFVFNSLQGLEDWVDARGFIWANKIDDRQYYTDADGASWFSVLRSCM